MAQTRVIAVNEIHRTVEVGKAADPVKGTPAVKPKVKIIAPGTIFMTKDDQEFKELKSANAIRIPAEADTVAVSAQAVVIEEETSPKKKTTSRGRSRKAAAPKADEGKATEEELV